MCHQSVTCLYDVIWSSCLLICACRCILNEKVISTHEENRKTTERCTNFTAVTYANYESSFTRTSHILASKILYNINNESNNTAVTCHPPFLSLTFWLRRPLRRWGDEWSVWTTIFVRLSLCGLLSRAKQIVGFSWNSVAFRCSLQNLEGSRVSWESPCWQQCLC